MYAAAFIGLWLLVRVLGADAFADYAWAMAAVALLGVGCTLGCDQLILIHIARHAEDAAAGVTRKLLLAVLAAGGAVLAMVALWTWADAATAGDGERWWLIALAGTAPLLGVASVLQNRCLARGRLWMSQTVVPLCQAARSPLLGIVWWLDGGAEGVVLVEWAVALLPPVIFLAADGWLRGPAGAPLSADVARQAPALLGGRLLFEANKRGDLVLLGLLAAAPAVAVYAIAGRLVVAVEAGRDLLQPAFTARAGAALRGGDRAALAAEYRTVQAGGLLGGLLAAAALTGGGAWLLRLFGAPDADVAPLALLAAAALANVGSGPGAHLLNLAGRAHATLVVRAVALAVMAALMWAIVPAHGAVGAGAAAGAAMLVANAAYAALLWRWQRLRMLEPAAALLLTGAIAVLTAVGAGGLAPAPAGLLLLGLALALMLVEPYSWRTASGALAALWRMAMRRGG